MGSIMIEENVVSAAGTSYQMSRDEMQHLIRSAGYEPRQRRPDGGAPVAIGSDPARTRC